MICIVIALFLGAVSDRAIILLKERGEVYEFFSVAFSNESDAKDIIRVLNDRFDKYGVVRMYDLYILANIEATARDCKFGWTNKPMFTITYAPTREENRWVINTPNPEPLEK